MKGNVYTTGSLNKSWNFQRFYRRAKIFINKYFVEGKLLKEVEVIFFFLEIYRNNDEAIFQWWRTMEKKLLQNENLYQVLGNECFDKFFIEHQLFRKQHCAHMYHAASVWWKSYALYKLQWFFVAFLHHRGYKQNWNRNLEIFFSKFERESFP